MWSPSRGRHPPPGRMYEGSGTTSTKAGLPKQRSHTGRCAHTSWSSGPVCPLEARGLQIPRAALVGTEIPRELSSLRASSAIRGEMLKQGERQDCMAGGTAARCREWRWGGSSSSSLGGGRSFGGLRCRRQTDTHTLARRGGDCELAGGRVGALCEAHRAATAAALTAGRAQAGAHGHVPGAGGAAHAARHWPGARHAQVPTYDPTSGAADTCGGRGKGKARLSYVPGAAPPCRLEPRHPFLASHFPLSSIHSAWALLLAVIPECAECP